jgi:hypothetical protein
MDGLAYISELLVRCKVREDTYLKCDLHPPLIPDQRYLNNSISALDIVRDHQARLFALNLRKLCGLNCETRFCGLGGSLAYTFIVSDTNNRI